MVNQSPPSQHSQEPFTKEEVRDVTRGAPAVPAAAAPLRLAGSMHARGAHFTSAPC